MKKFILFLLVAAAVLPLVLTGCAREEVDGSDCVRIHIRANGNGEEDQRVKLAVRDRIVEYLTPLLCEAIDTSAAEKIIEENKGKIVKIADGTLLEGGFGYRAAARLTTEYFPARSYDGVVFPSGEYRALIVELGLGAGDNWWCVAFPPLCFLEDGKTDGPVQYKSLIKETVKKWRKNK
jgi:stage II sporulation protein R